MICILVIIHFVTSDITNASQEKLEGSAGGKGTGGTDLMKFLKPIRDNCGERSVTLFAVIVAYSVEEFFIVTLLSSE
jgi:Indoleamine 2,3-dioxygenase